MINIFEHESKDAYPIYEDDLNEDYERTLEKYKSFLTPDKTFDKVKNCFENSVQRDEKDIGEEDQTNLKQHVRNRKVELKDIPVFCQTVNCQEISLDDKEKDEELFERFKEMALKFYDINGISLVFFCYNKSQNTYSSFFHPIHSPSFLDKVSHKIGGDVYLEELFKGSPFLSFNLPHKTKIGDSLQVFFLLFVTNPYQLYLQNKTKQKQNRLPINLEKIGFLGNIQIPNLEIPSGKKNQMLRLKCGFNVINKINSVISNQQDDKHSKIPLDVDVRLKYERKYVSSFRNAKHKSWNLVEGSLIIPLHKCLSFCLSVLKLCYVKDVFDYKRLNLALKHDGMLKCVREKQQEEKELHQKWLVCKLEFKNLTQNLVSVENEIDEFEKYRCRVEQLEEKRLRHQYRKLSKLENCHVNAIDSNSESDSDFDSNHDH